MNILVKLWRTAFVQQIADVFVSMWRELLICAAALVAILVLMTAGIGNLP